MDDLTETDYNICMMAIGKCHLLQRAVKAGLPCNLTKDNFGFPEMTADEEYALITKLYRASELAWLRSQPKEILCA
jgi:hypothetical protein